MPARAYSSCVMGLPARPRKGCGLAAKSRARWRRRDVAVVLRLHGAAFVGFDVAALSDPGFAQARQAARHVDARRSRRCRARRIVDAERRLAGLLRQRDLAQRHAQDRGSLPAPSRPCVDAGSGPVVTFGSVSSELRVTLFMAWHPVLGREGGRRRQRSGPWRNRCRCGRCRRRRGARWSRRDRARWASSGRRGTRARIGGR